MDVQFALVTQLVGRHRIAAGQPTTLVVRGLERRSLSTTANFLINRTVIALPDISVNYLI